MKFIKHEWTFLQKPKTGKSTKWGKGAETKRSKWKPTGRGLWRPTGKKHKNPDPQL